jgi:hypothetical protein
VRLASYPPYHSQDKPIERCWGSVENHWNGAVRDAIDAGLHCAPTMPWKGRHPGVALVTPTDETGVTGAKDAMEAVETPLKRVPRLAKWFVDVVYSPSRIRDASLFLSPLLSGQTP